MNHSTIVEYAHALFHAHGDRAEAEAAQRARHYREEGAIEHSDNWQAIRVAIKGMRGPSQG
ncbi:MAG: hypothetical protein ACJAXT_000618 [Paracoccaceae bacterium]|jgi:hypothetical protein